VGKERNYKIDVGKKRIENGKKTKRVRKQESRIKNKD